MYLDERLKNGIIKYDKKKIIKIKSCKSVRLFNHPKSKP